MTRRNSANIRNVKYFENVIRPDFLSQENPQNVHIPNKYTFGITYSLFPDK